MGKAHGNGGVTPADEIEIIHGGNGQHPPHVRVTGVSRQDRGVLRAFAQVHQADTGRAEIERLRAQALRDGEARDRRHAEIDARGELAR